MMEFYVRMELEKYKIKYQWWLMGGVSVIVFGFCLLFSIFGAISYYSFYVLIYVMPPLLTGTIIFLQGMRMRKTHREMQFMLEKLKDPNIPLENSIRY